jgi:arabinan endo-1,5-alpha-L-arabinosidase
LKHKLTTLSLLSFLITGCTIASTSLSDSIFQSLSEGSVSTSETIVPMMYTNPVWEPILADPAIIRHEDTFYAYGTQDYGQWGEDDYGVRYTPILESKDMVNWTYAGQVFTAGRRPLWGTFNSGLWAPDIVKIGDTFNLYYSLSTWGDPDPGIGVATASHPLGPWTDHGKVLRSLEIGVNNSIDPAVFVEDGRVYMIWGSFRGLYGVELTSDGLALLDGEQAAQTKILIAGFDTSTQWNGTTYEAPFIYKKNQYFYMFVSSGTCCAGHSSSYNVRVARSTNPLGPYIDSNGASMLGSYRGHQVVVSSFYFAGPGHNAVIADDEGNDWLVYHAFNTAEPPNFGNSPRRSLMIDKLIWDEFGWPTVATLMPSRNAQPAPIIHTSQGVSL